MWVYINPPTHSNAMEIENVTPKSRCSHKKAKNNLNKQKKRNERQEAGIIVDGICPFPFMGDSFMNRYTLYLKIRDTLLFVFLLF